MGTSVRFWAIGTASLVAISAAAGCNDHDRTEICVGPDCPEYDGVGGQSNYFRSNEDTAGSAGNASNAGASSDAGTLPDGGPNDGDGGPSAPTCELAFVLPSAADAGALTVDGSSDTDGEACGTQFSLGVTLTSNASTVGLFVNNAPFSTQNVVDGSVSFDAVLGNRGSTANVLRAEATMADGSTCSLTFASDIFVDCAGPSCSIDSPVANNDGYLNASQDLDGASGLQTDVLVGTELENAGQTVRLEIDGAFGTVPDAQVASDNGGGTATFGNLTLAEGPRTVRAQCRDALGLETLSAPATFNVDTTPCTLSISTIAGGSNPITPADDQSPGTPGVQALVNGTITGGDCKNLWIGMCGGALASLPLSLPQNGSFSLPVTLTGSTGSVDVCGSVEDLAGNMSAQDHVTVNLRLDGPQVAIVTPATSARYNRAGNAGAIADLDALTSSCEAAVAVNCTEVGQNVQLLADGLQIAQANCAAQGGLPSPFLGQATFAQATLTTKNDGTATVLTAQQTVSGFAAAVSAPVSVQADCEAPSCALVSPSSSLDFLNASLDSDAAAGLQVNFDVQSDANSLGQNARLIIDGDSNGAPSSVLVAQGGGTRATFADVALSEGPRSVQAECSDSAGNVQTTTAVNWTVDSVPCSANTLVIAAGASPITPALDSNLAAGGLQVQVSGQATGGDCSSVRVGVCGSLTGSGNALSGAQSFSGLELTLLNSTSSQDVCVEVTDAAGNVGQAQASVLVRVDPPVVAITSPSNGSAFNLSSASQCDTTLVVSCTDIGDPVELLVDGTPSDVQSCGLDNTVSFPVSLASKDDGSTTTLAVQQQADGMLSVLDSIDVQADCNAPVLAFTAPACGSVLGLNTADLGAAPGVQANVTVTNGGIPDVTLTVARGGSGTSTSATGDSISTTFTLADLGGPGLVDLSACATDAQGNQGCTTACQLTIAAEPVINITAPTDGATLVIANDCGAAAGLQVTVTGTTNAANGSPVSVQIGSGTPALTNVASGSFSACVDAPHGAPEVATAQVTDSVTGLTGTASVTLAVNALPSVAAPITSVVGRRQGTIQFTWTPVNDPLLGTPLSTYELRCAASDITDEATWSSARIPSATVAPALVSGSMVGTFSGFRTGTRQFCVVRATNSGFLGPIGPGQSATVSNPFSTAPYTVATATTFRVGMAAIGDINGDQQNDFIVGSEGNGAQVFFGGSDFDTTPDITISGVAGRLGSVVAGLGDVNGDGKPDFAVAAPTLTNGAATSAGSVFVFFGRDAGDPAWPSTISVAADPGCGANVCFHGTQSFGNLGNPIVATNFDGTGPMDIAFGVQNQNTRIGRVYVVLGGSQMTDGATFKLPTGSNPDGFQIDPPGIDSFFGASLTTVGDGGDGLGDLVIGAVGRTTGNVSGAAYFLSGQAPSGGGLKTPAVGTLTQFATGNPSQFATAVGGLGDFDGDGFDDVCVAHDFQTANGGGNCTVYLGRDPQQGGGFTASSLLNYTNDVGDNDWSNYVAPGRNPQLGLIGDLDGDGLGELLLGSLTTGPFNTGTAELFYGDNQVGSRIRSKADMHFSTADQGNVFAAFLGDIDGDGFNDLAMFDTDAGTTSRVTLLY